MKHLAFSCLLLLGFAQKLSAQCAPQILNCPAAATVEVCDTSGNSLQFWNAPHWPNSAIGGSNLADAPADLSISARDTCGNALIISYLIFLDLNNDGLQETVVNSLAPPPAGAVYYGNAANPNFTGGQHRLFDQRPVPNFFRYRFALETQTTGGVTTARLRWRTPATIVGGVLPQLPYGKHRIRWTVRNAAGQEAVCEYAVTVKDCGKPTLKCLEAPTVNLFLCDKSTPIFAWELLHSTADNYDPANSQDVRIREAGSGTGFPPPDAEWLYLGCPALGEREVELWARDRAGNLNHCLVKLTVTDTNGFCAPQPKHTVCLERWCDGGKIEEAVVYVAGWGVGIPPMIGVQTSDSSGCTILKRCKVPLSASVTITAVKDTDPLEGLDQADLDRLERHLNGTEPFAETWQFIAADANKSGSITSFDLEEFKKLLDGIYVELPNNTSWRFVDPSFVFSDPLNPFKSAFRENVTVSNVTSDTTIVLLGIKIGDLTCSVPFAGQLEDRAQHLEKQTLVAYPYPNPTTGGTTFLLQLAEASDAALTLTDLASREVYHLDFSGVAGENRVEIPASALPQAGLYLWRVSAGGSVRTGKLLRW